MEMALMLPLLFFLIAFFYAMVGFGGGSSYLAVLVLLNFSYQKIPAIALLCNLVVTCGGCWHFYRAGHLNVKQILPFVLLSIPMAYLGGRLHLPKEIFCLLLGASLFSVALRMFLNFKEFSNTHEVSPKKMWAIGLPLGGLLGFLSGVVGIGGGIFLSPILLLLGWANIKEAAACASFFIVVNSASGLLGHLEKGSIDFAFALPLMLATFVGGQMGSRLGAYRIPKLSMQRMVAVLVFYVSVKLMMKGVL